MPVCEGCHLHWDEGSSWSHHKGQCRLRQVKQDESLEQYRQALLQRQNEAERPLSPSLSYAIQPPGSPRPSSLQWNPEAHHSLSFNPTQTEDATELDDFDQFAVEYLHSLDNTGAETGSPDLPATNLPVTLNRTESPHRTLPDKYGLFRIYPTGRPSWIPSDFILPDSPTIHSDIHFDNPYSQDTIDYSTAPITQSAHKLLNHWWSPGTNKKTIRDGDRLVNDVLLDPDFKVEELRSWRGMARETQLLDAWLQDLNLHLPVKDKWIKAAIDLPIPSTKSHAASEQEAPKFRIENVHYRQPLDVIQNALSEPGAERLHLFPYEEYWKHNSDAPAVRTYGELYTSDAFLAEHKAIKQRVEASGRTIETVVIGLMFWSDATHLSSFGTASLWPVYMYIGNQSKYIRSKPSSFSAHHIAYIPKMPDEFYGWFSNQFGANASDDHLAFLRKEIYQAVWALLLNPEFIHAYFHGFEWEFWDKVVRLCFLRIFTHSADYPEKLMVACLKYFAQCPCPRCLMPKHMIYRLGTVWDKRFRKENPRVDSKEVRHAIETARNLVFEGLALKNDFVEDLLSPLSLTLTRSTVSKELGDSGFNVYETLVPDILHEVELGVWKGIFTHLIRILHSRGARYINLLNERYRETPTFGRDTIRRFVNNVSDMKKMGGRDFEDLLQCSIPAFQNLFLPQHNKLIQQLLFEVSTWHALAKLRKHTQYTLGELDASTTRLGTLLRKFAKETQDDYDTRDLPSETAKKARARAARMARKATGAAPGQDAESSTTDVVPQSGKKRHLSLLTAKIHALGHVTDAIVAYGTTDSYNTMLGESEHRHSKGWAARAKKGGPEVYTEGIAKLERRERAILRTDPTLSKRNQARQDGTLPFEYSELLPKASSDDHHQMSHEASSKNALDLTEWMAENQHDPAVKDFDLKLKRHLFCRLQGLDYTDDEQQFTPEQLATVILLKDTIYRHKFLRVNYTAYDKRREQDSINARTHPDIMMLSHDDKASVHPYWYARVRGIFHAKVYVNDPNSMAPTRQQDVEVVWIRWLGVHYPHRHGWRAKHLPKVGFVEPSDDGSAIFDFVDPTDIIRAVHLIPDFESGQSTNGLGPTLARPESDKDVDWNFFYVNIFVDRDMFMRYRGGGIGHVDTQAAVDVWLKDRDKLDAERTEKELQRYTVDTADEDEEMEPGDELEEEGVPMQIDDDDESVRSEEVGEPLPEALAEGLLLEEALDYGFEFGGEQSDGEDEEHGIEGLEENWGVEDGENGMGEMAELDLADL